MRLGKIVLPSGESGLGVLVPEGIRVLPFPAGCRSLADVLYSSDPRGLVQKHLGESRLVSLAEVDLQAPIDHQEVWAAG